MMNIKLLALSFSNFEYIISKENRMSSSDFRTLCSRFLVSLLFQAARDASDEQRAEDAARLLALAEAEVAAEQAAIVDEADTRGEGGAPVQSVQSMAASAKAILHLRLLLSS